MLKTKQDYINEIFKLVRNREVINKLVYNKNFRKFIGFKTPIKMYKDLNKFKKEEYIKIYKEVLKISNDR